MLFNDPSYTQIICNSISVLNIPATSMPKPYIVQDPTRLANSEFRATTATTLCDYKQCDHCSVIIGSVITAV